MSHFDPESKAAYNAVRQIKETPFTPMKMKKFEGRCPECQRVLHMAEVPVTDDRQAGTSHWKGDCVGHTLHIYAEPKADFIPAKPVSISEVKRRKAGANA